MKRKQKRERKNDKEGKKSAKVGVKSVLLLWYNANFAIEICDVIWINYSLPKLIKSIAAINHFD